MIAEPLFAVADGMGGAQAGEVASRTAADVFEHVTGGGGQPEQLLTDLTREANRQIFEMSQSDASRRGMGTTLTAAMVWSEGVSIGHVGDSRAYRLRDGELEQLTHDHSLVAELSAQRAADRRGGREPPAALDHHPRAGARVRRGGGRPHAHRPRRATSTCCARTG